MARRRDARPERNVDQEPTERIAIKVRLDQRDLPPMAYVNHLLSHFTGAEVVLYGTQVERPFPADIEDAETPPTELPAKIQARWAMSPDRYVDHVARSLEMIQRNPVLKAIYDEIERQRKIASRR